MFSTGIVLVYLLYCFTALLLYCFTALQSACLAVEKVCGGERVSERERERERERGERERERELYWELRSITGGG